MSAHRWRYCEECSAWMVVCGLCSNNTCNGGSGERCPDKCESARAFEAAKTDRPESSNARERVRRERALRNVATASAALWDELSKRVAGSGGLTADEARLFVKTKQALVELERIRDGEPEEALQ